MRKVEPEDPDRIDRPIRSEARGHAGERRLRRIVGGDQGRIAGPGEADDRDHDAGCGLALHALSSPPHQEDRRTDVNLEQMTLSPVMRRPLADARL
jgi:hypothetical protein